MIENYQQTIEGRITVQRYTFGRLRTCINTLNIWRSVCRNFNIGPYVYLSICKNNKVSYLDGPMHFYLGPIIILTKKLTLSYLAQCIFRNSRNLLRVSYFVVVLKSDKRVIYIIAPSIIKEWRLLLDGRRISITFLL